MDEEKQALIKKYDLEILDLLNATKEKRVNIGRFRSMVIKNGGLCYRKKAYTSTGGIAGASKLKDGGLASHVSRSSCHKTAI